jgi:uncharacterized protein (TIGR03118 family)
MHPRLAGIPIAAATVGVAVVITAAGSLPAEAGTHRQLAASTHGTQFHRTNLVSDQPGKAEITDPNLVNAWGMSRGPDTPIWVSDNGTNVSTLYTGAVGGKPVSAVPLVVGTPGGAPTGQVFNDTSAFTVPGTGKPAAFIFAGEGGDLSAWNPSTSPITQAVHVAHTPDAVYKGLALVHSPFGPLLLAANFHDNRLDVFNGRFRRLHVDRLFRDEHLPKGYAPFNVATIGHRVFVTYAKQDADRTDDVPGSGHGFIDTFTTYGAFLHRFASRGQLNSPWGLTVAPAHFGRWSHKLLVGNFGNGRIHVFGPQTGRELGTLRGSSGHAIVIDGLWGLLVGDSVAGGPDAVWFSAGPDGEAHGLLGILTKA